MLFRFIQVHSGLFWLSCSGLCLFSYSGSPIPVSGLFGVTAASSGLFNVFLVFLFWFVPIVLFQHIFGLFRGPIAVYPPPALESAHAQKYLLFIDGIFLAKKKTVHNALILQIPRTEKNEAQPQTQHPQMVVIVSLSASVACCAKGIQAPPGHRVVVPICAHLQGCRRLGNPWREWWIAMLG